MALTQDGCWYPLQIQKKTTKHQLQEAQESKGLLRPDKCSSQQRDTQTGQASMS